MLNMHCRSGTGNKLAAALLVAAGALASMRAYAGSPSERVASAAAVQRYQISMVVSVNGLEKLPAKVISEDGKRFSIKVGSEVNGKRYDHFSAIMTATKQGDEISLQGEIGLGTEGNVVARPQLVMVPGKPTTIEASDSAGGTFKMEITIEHAAAPSAKV